MKYLRKYNEDFDNDFGQLYDFNKCVYLPEEKSIVGAYMVIGETEKLLTLLNIREVGRDMIFFDNAKSYDITIHRVSLPKSSVTVLDSVEGKEGFNFVKIPYYLYKNNIDDLTVVRIKGSYDGAGNYKKRIDIPFNKLERGFWKEFKDPNVVSYIKQTNDDHRTVSLISYYSKGDFE